MKIHLTKGDGRNVLTCVRADGSHTRADVGPGLPFHDLAHYVVEAATGMRGGFFGLVSSGHALADLADPRRVVNATAELGLTEVLVRALQACHAGACRPDQLLPMVIEEVGADALGGLDWLGQELEVRRLVDRFDTLLARWSALPSGESLSLDFPDPPPS
jgi:hypothetical protein